MTDTTSKTVFMIPWFQKHHPSLFRVVAYDDGALAVAWLWRGNHWMKFVKSLNGSKSLINFGNPANMRVSKDGGSISTEAKVYD